MRRAALGLFALLSACGDGAAPGAEQGGPTPASPTASPPPRGIAPELRSAPLALGGWTFKPIAGDPAALFGPPAGEARFYVRCETAARRLLLVRSGELETGSGTMRLIADDREVALPARPTGGELPHIEARLAADDAFVRALASGVERLGVAIGQGPMLVMPGDAAIGRAAHACTGG